MKSARQADYFKFAPRFFEGVAALVVNKASTIARPMVGGDVGAGRLNRMVGWGLLVMLFASASWLDPLALSERSRLDSTASLRAATSMAQPVIAVMAFLLLATSQLIKSLEDHPTKRRIISFLASGGTLSCVGGFHLSAWWPSMSPLIPAGALMLLMAFLQILLWAPTVYADLQLRLMTFMICFAMTLVAVMGLFQSHAELFLPAYLGPEDGFRMRMLRLARVAAIALPVLAILYKEIEAQGHGGDLSFHRGRFAMVFGAMGLPFVLAGAGFTYGDLKLLLLLPTLATFLGTLYGASLARRHNYGLEFWGWSLIASSMAAGMVMGLYAFLVPPLPLQVLADYNDAPRRLIRLAHIYGVLFGMAIIFLSRDRGGVTDNGWTRTSGAALLGMAAVITIGAILLRAAFHSSSAALGIGPALAALAITLSFAPDILRTFSTSGRRPRSYRRR